MPSIAISSSSIQALASVPRSRFAITRKTTTNNFFSAYLDLGLKQKIRGSKAFLVRGGLKSSNGAPIDGFVKKRKIVEHILLLRARKDLSQVEEEDILDHLYTCQYQMSGILAISLGRIEESNMEGVTHAVYMRFQRKEDVSKFYANSHFAKIFKEHVTPNCYGYFSVEYESSVDDDILPIFRRGEEYNFGVECVLLLSIIKTAPTEAVEDALTSLHNLILEFNSDIVQATLGCNLNVTDSEYTHASVIRFPSTSAFKMFRESSTYNNIWELKLKPITQKYLLLHFAVNPVGTELM